MGIHRLRNHLRDVRESKPAFQKRRHRDLVGRVQHDRQAPLRFEGAVGQAQARKIVPRRLVKLEGFLLREIEKRHRRVPAIGIREGVLNRQAHVGDAHLRDDRSVLQLDHRVHDRLRVNNDVDLRGGHAKQPMRLDHLQPLVHQCGRIDGDLRAHLPGRMLQRVGGGDPGQLAQRPAAKRAAGGSENQPPQFPAGAAVQALMDRVVLAVDR